VGSVTLLDEDWNSLLLIDLLLVGAELAGLDKLLSVVPSATSVGGREGNLDAGSDGTRQHARNELVAEEGAENERGKDHNAAGKDHLLEGGSSGDLDTVVVVGVFDLTS